VNRSTLWKQRLLFAALYFSEGAPIGYLWWALPTQLRLAHMPIEHISTLTSLLVLPWTFKFLWAPAVDVLRNAGWTLKHWILGAQLAMTVFLLPLFFLDATEAFSIVLFFLLLHAVAAATQDVAIDALAIHAVPSQERGRVNGWMQAGMLLGRSLFGGVALVFLTQYDERWVLVFLIAAILSSAIVLARSRIEPINGSRGKMQHDRRQLFVHRLTAVLHARLTWLGFIVALLGGAAFEGVGSVAGPFLVDRSLPQETVGTFFSIAAVGAMTLGSLAGGYMADRINKAFATAIVLILTAIVVVAIAATDIFVRGERELLIGIMTTLYFCIGLFTATSYALFMELSEPTIAATQFSAFMGVTNLCESWAALLIGRLIASTGYPRAFLVMSLLSLTALPALVKMQRTLTTER